MIEKLNMKTLNIKKAKPMFSGIITTCDRYTDDDCIHLGIIDTTKLGKIKEFQTIVSMSDQAISRGLVVGNLLALSFERYKKSKSKRDNSIINDTDEHYNKEIIYELPVILLDNREHMLVDISDIELIVEEFEYTNEGEENILIN